jgi:Flp pilus assembly pilin Flp
MSFTSHLYSPADMQHLDQLVRNEDGQDVAEYGLLVAGVGLLVLVGTTSLSTNLYTWFGVLAARITSTVGA